MNIYLAHPISSLSYEQVRNYYQGMIDLLSPYYTVFCPLVQKGYLKGETKLHAGGYAYPPSTDHAIIERDAWMVRISDVVYLDLSGTTHVSIGCIMELAWAHLLRKHAVVVMEEDNLHHHAFIHEAADIIFTKAEDALRYLIGLAEGKL